MNRQDDARLGDIVEAVEAIRDHLTRGDLHDGLVYDAVRVRLGEHRCRHSRHDLLGEEPGVQGPLDNELGPLLAAVESLAKRLADDA